MSQLPISMDALIHLLGGKVQAPGIRRWIREEGMPSLKIGRQRYFDLEVVSAWMKSRHATSPNQDLLALAIQKRMLP